MNDTTIDPTPSPEQVLQACATEPLANVVSVLAACTNPPRTSDLAGVAIAHGRTDVIQYLLGTGTPPGYLPIAAIVRKCDTTLLEILLKEGRWDINEGLGSYRGCALTSAMLDRAPTEFIAWLLDHGADPDGEPALVDHHGYALQLAVRMSTEEATKPTEVAQLLLSRGANVDRSKALHCAAESKGIEWVRWLVEEGRANVNAPRYDPDLALYTDDENGSGMPLHYAVRCGNIEVVKYLLSKGTNSGQQDSLGRTPRQLAEHLGRDEIAKILSSQ